MSRVAVPLIAAAALLAYWLYLCKCERQQRREQFWEEFWEQHAAAIVAASRRLGESLKAMSVSAAEAQARIERAFFALRKEPQ